MKIDITLPEIVEKRKIEYPVLAEHISGNGGGLIALFFSEKEAMIVQLPYDNQFNYKLGVLRGLMKRH